MTAVIQNELEPLRPDQLESLIVILRGQRVMLSPHLAQLYGVEPRTLIQAVKRNPERFPVDFMFQLTRAETARLRTQFVTANDANTEADDGFKSQFVISSEVGTRAPPYAFTEQGVAMLSSVLRSPRAVAVNIEIMRAFVRLRHLLAGNADLARRLEELEASVRAGSEKTDQQFQVVFDAIRQLMTPPAPKQRRIGFRQEGNANMAAHCTHLDHIQNITPRTPEGCEECLASGDTWVHLRLCLECGHIGCCDSSKNKHATKHFHATQHPIMQSFQPGEDWRWCYIDEMAV